MPPLFDMPSAARLATVPSLKIDGARAVWIDEHTIAVPREMDDASGAVRTWRGDDVSDWLLMWSPSAQTSIGEGGVHARDLTTIPLAVNAAGMETRQRALHPHLVGHTVLRVPDQWQRSVAEMLTGQLLVARRTHGRIAELTGLQLGPVIDAVYGRKAYADPQGPTFHDGRIQLGLWAPTARRVDLLLWEPDAGPAPRVETARRRSMMRGPHGTWTARLAGEAVGSRYLFEVHVYVPSTGRLETNLVTDPYSSGLTVDSQRSVLVDLEDPAWMPDDWANSVGPRLVSLADAAVYELHVRDFSMTDALVPEDLRGSYLAFGVDGHGSRHLRRLARAGLNTVHLLPCFDVTSIPEQALQPQPAEEELRMLAPDSPVQQKLVARGAAHDAFNWGYDPYHWGAPEGSYTSRPEAADGARRTREFRQMVHALHGLGLRVVMDQVFTHTGASGQNPFSVLDRIVPGYHHRLDARGAPEGSTAANNVATERLMTERLMVDMVVRWAKHYHVDGFRFDLMGHSSVRNMARVRAALDKLTLTDDGVDGHGVYLYGEGWNFGEVADNALFTQAVQGQLSGTRIATFNDRIRDAVRGGRPFDEDPRRQGFGTGLATDPNGAACNREPERMLGHDTDLLMLGLTGNLADYLVPCTDGTTRRGADIDYGGRPAGYAIEPTDVINYVDAHDNETLWDALLLKLPVGMDMGSRIRMNTLCLATVALGQAPFLWHAGADLLRSKSLDRNSYNAGDWFNRLDWTGEDNGFGHGLPSADDNMTRWHWLRPLLRESSLKPTAEDVMEAARQAEMLLRLRRSTRLFRLGTAELVRTKLSFPLSGTERAVPGVITMHIDDRFGPRIDQDLLGVVVVFNTRGEDVRQEISGLAGERLVINPVQLDGPTDVMRRARFDGGVFEVPARTVAVFNHMPS
ncbi:pullulanase-type alpha-1,6-glucosidase [Luteococcus japonicus]|uniref:Pullulanase-type alpha-1,6-glucosidase n=1 Tax=Luteococcus japonicus TaxID=33984 RepID=A0A3N1ZY41_9ACTN|nr:pullulanase-type alpha-1,6-glucosidase [Luteococcus japonicus]ROR55773.1 pullulanase-type alpha-1,6-glucosidase [Luteococcus japonicus]